MPHPVEFLGLRAFYVLNTPSLRVLQFPHWHCSHAGSPSSIFQSMTQPVACKSVTFFFPGLLCIPLCLVSCGPLHGGHPIWFRISRFRWSMCPYISMFHWMNSGHPLSAGSLRLPVFVMQRHLCMPPHASSLWFLFVVDVVRHVAGALQVPLSCSLLSLQQGIRQPAWAHPQLPGFSQFTFWRPPDVCSLAAECNIARNAFIVCCWSLFSLRNSL